MIRRLKTAQQEKDVIMKIWLDATVEAHHFIEKDYWHENYDTVKNVYLPQSETFVLVEDGNILGFISILNKGYIGALFIDINHQGKGIGRKLIEYAQRQYRELTLAVYKDNDQAVRFYKNNGFKIISEQLNTETSKLEYIMNVKG